MVAVDGSVVDPTSMKVHGIEGLRVVDASSMPYVTNGNIYAPVMMLAEKASDLILGNTPLPAENVPYYVHATSHAPPTPNPAPRIEGGEQNSSGSPPSILGAGLGVGGA